MLHARIFRNAHASVAGRADGTTDDTPNVTASFPPRWADVWPGGMQLRIALTCSALAKLVQSPRVPATIIFLSSGSFPDRSRVTFPGSHRRHPVFVEDIRALRPAVALA